MPASSHNKRVFISYARADGEEFAVQLRERLEREAPNIGTVWQDRSQLEGGVGWWKQVTAAIEQSEYMASVMTRVAMESPIVRREWRHARQQGTCGADSLGRIYAVDPMP